MSTDRSSRNREAISELVNNAQQLALTLFTELAPQGATAEELPIAVGYKRNNIFIDINDLSLLARRAIDVLYFVAAQNTEFRPMYELELEFFKWLMSYSSDNRKHLRTVLREGQKAAIQVEVLDEHGAALDEWISVPLLGPVGISKGRIFFEINDKLQQHIKSPRNSHFLSLRYVFRSIHTKIIFDHIQPYIEAEMTPWYSLETVRGWMGFSGNEGYTEFKKLRQRVLDRAVNQINDITPLTISYDTMNVPGSKRVAQIRFRIRAEPHQDATKAPMITLQRQYEVLRNEFGLNGAQLAEIVSHRDEWDDDRLARAIEYTRWQLEEGKIKRNPAGYLMKSIREDVTLGEAMKKIRDSKVAHGASALHVQQTLVDHHAAAREAMDRNTNDLGPKGYAAFLALSSTEQTKYLAAFASTAAGTATAAAAGITTKQLRERHADIREVQLQFGLYMAKRLSIST